MTTSEDTDMSKAEILKWLNNNQGIVVVAIFVLTILGGLLKFVLGKRTRPKPSIRQKLDLKAGRDIIVEGDNISLVNLQTTGFSDLEKQVADMGSQLKEVLDKMKPSPPSVKSTPKNDSEDYKRVMTLISGEPTQDKKKQLRAIFYSSNDNNARLQIVLSLACWCFWPEDSIDDLIAMCDEGVRIADSIGAKSEKAVLLAYKGSFVSMQFSDADMRAAFSVQASNLTGIPLITEEQRQQTIRKIRKLDKLSQECFASAEKVAKEAKSYSALGLVYSIIGEAAGQRYIHLKRFGVDRAEEEKRLCKRALLLAKEIYSATGDELGTAYALHNLANQLRFFDEAEEAKQLTETVIEIATKHDEQLLLKKANGLLKRIVSGRIPNYMGGETCEF
jgi:tetratricopeptide (TPR) repeat protein